MAYTIRSIDGRLSISTSDADAAAEHLVRLQLMGFSVVVSDVNGAQYEVPGLLSAAHAVSVERGALGSAA